MTKSEHILAILQERYICGAVPIGALAQIGQEVGVSRELVRKVANKNGFDGRIPKSRKRRLCRAGCGDDAAFGKSYCEPCSVIPVACADCGTFGTRPRDIILSHASDPRYKTGNYFCSKVCFGRWSGKNRGFGSDTHPRSSNRGTHGVWGHRNACRCGVCVAAFKANNRKNYERWLSRKAERAAAGS